MVTDFVLGTVMQGYVKEFCFMERSRTPDGVGGFVTQWADGEHFEAVERHDTTVEAQIAEQASTAATYTLYLNKGVPLAFPDYIKRLEDGQTFQVTSDAGDKVAPAESGMDLKCVMCKKAVLP